MSILALRAASCRACCHSTRPVRLMPIQTPTRGQPSRVSLIEESALMKLKNSMVAEKMRSCAWG